MRRGEVLGLKWKDLDFVKGTIHVRRALEQTKKFGVRMKVPKKHSRRLISLPAVIVAALREHRKQQLELRMKLGAGKDKQDMMFPTWDGKVRTPNGLTTDFRRLVHAAGIPHGTFHMLRHTHASQLLRMGEPITSVSKRLGHKNPAITLQVYSHVFDGMDESAAEKTDQIMNKILTIQ